MNNIFDKNYERYDTWYEQHRFAGPLGIQFGIDPSKQMLEIAKKRGINVQPASGENLPFSDASFDYIAIIITVCFVKNPQEVIKEASRVLKKNGKIILGIVDKNSFLGKFYRNKKSIFYKQASFFTIKELTGLLVSAGFSNASYYQTLYDLPDRINSIQKPEKEYGKGGFVVIKACKPGALQKKRKYGQNKIPAV